MNGRYQKINHFEKNAITGHYKGNPYYGESSPEVVGFEIVTPQEEIHIDEGRFYSVSNRDRYSKTVVSKDTRNEKRKIKILDGAEEINLGPSFGYKFRDTFGDKSDIIRELVSQNCIIDFNEEEELFWVVLTEHLKDSIRTTLNIYENEKACINGEKPIIISRYREYKDNSLGYKWMAAVRHFSKEKYLSLVDRGLGDVVSDVVSFETLNKNGYFPKIPKQALEVINRGYEPEYWMTEICDAIKAKEEQTKATAKSK